MRQWQGPIWVYGSAMPMREVNPVEIVLKAVARLAAASGVIALLIWLTWVMLDLKNLKSGFTLP